MESRTLKYFRDLQKTKSPDDLKSRTSKFLDALGFSMFTYLCYSPEEVGEGAPPLTKAEYVNATFVQSTYPTDWVDHYVTNDLLYVDPVVQDAKKSLLPFVWDSSEPRPGSTAKQKQFLKAARPFGIKRGVVVPIFAPGGEFAIFAAVFNGSSAGLREAWKTYKNDLHFTGIYYHAAICELVFKRKVRPTPALSPRERQTLQWAARGKTLWETAQIMGISEGTAKTYLKDAMRKLETSNKTHAVSKALLHGLINV